MNAFFVDPSCFDTLFLDEIQGLEFAENRYQFLKFRRPSNEQFEQIGDRKFVPI